MIRASQMPPEVVAAIWATLKREGGATMAEALAAGLSAWPGSFQHTFRGPLEGYGLVLPLPQEVSDE